MSTFALEEIEAVKGKQAFHKLVVDGECPLDKFESEIEACYKSELTGLYSIMNQVANLKSVPQNKFHFFDKAKGEYREFEFKSKHLRIYGVTQTDGKVIITGGTKATQAKDATLFRKLKKDYINFKQLSDKSPKP